jgi:hypothetical protein
VRDGSELVAVREPSGSGSVRSSDLRQWCERGKE